MKEAKDIYVIVRRLHGGDNVDGGEWTEVSLDLAFDSLDLAKSRLIELKDEFEKSDEYEDVFYNEDPHYLEAMFVTPEADYCDWEEISYQIISTKLS